MTDIIYQRGVVRENTIWPSFLYNGPFDTTAIEERTTLFGLYANTYLHGYNYLKAIETEDLARLVDNYTVGMAQLTNNEAQTVLEITAKYYIEKITNQIHTTNIVTKEKQLDSLDAEYDARTEALDADYAALQTMRDKVQLAWDKASQKVKDLEMRTELEDIAQQLVTIDITEQELKAARADLAVIEAGLKGLDIQLQITQTGIDITNTDLQIIQAENEVDEIDIRVSETEVQESGVDLDITNAEISLSKTEAAGERTKVDTQGVAFRVSEVQLQTTETEAKEYQMDAEISKIDADTARLGLVNSELTITQADKRITQAENELLIQEKNLITSQGQNVAVETAFRETQKGIQETLDDNIQSNDQGVHDFKMDMSQKETKYEDDMKTKKVDALDAKKGLADDRKTLRLEDADYKDRLLTFRGDIVTYKYDQQIAHAQLLADANIVNQLTHSIGQS